LLPVYLDHLNTGLFQFSDPFFRVKVYQRISKLIELDDASVLRPNKAELKAVLKGEGCRERFN
jgi:hypothetical protein